MSVAMHRKTRKSRYRTKFWRNYLTNNYQLYLMLVPVLLYYFLFHYLPYSGLLMAFQDYKLGLGIEGSEFVGLKHFHTLFRSSEFWKILKNTIALNLLNLVLYFPAPIILAILLNEIRNVVFKRVAQSLMYLPYFFSWVVIGGMFVDILSPGTGVVNKILSALTGGKTIFFMASTFWWPIMFVLSTMYKEVGWGSIIYLAAITGIDAELYEAARIDGANRWQQILHVTLPCISQTIVILLILRMGSVLNVGMEQILMLENAAVKSISDVISTYTYRMGIQQLQYSKTTAIGVFQSLINMVLMLLANHISKRLTGDGIW